MQIVHPLLPSQASDFGKIKTRIKIPADAKPPYLLSFYVSDNNSRDAPPKGKDLLSLMIDTRVKHRFQKCFIDGKEVWAQDTCLIDTDLPQAVDITSVVEPGREFELELGLCDEVDSGKELPGDRLETHNTKESWFATDFAKFETRSYWGDVRLFWGGKRPENKPGAWPWEIKVHRPAPDAVARNREPSLNLENAELLQGRWSWPVTMGIPFAEGTIAKQDNAVLTADGKPHSASFAALSRWPDGSMKWALLHTTLSPGSTHPLKRTIEKQSPEPLPEHAVVATAKSGDRQARIGNGLVSVLLDLNRDSLLSVEAASGRKGVDGLEVYSETNGSLYRASWHSLETRETSPWSSETWITGDLKDGHGKRLGTCQLRIAVFANVPYARCLFSVFNETPGISETARYGLRFKMSPEAKLQSGEGWATASTPDAGVTFAYRYFKHLWPDGIACEDNKVDFQIFKPGDERTPVLKTLAGESRTSEIWLAITGDATTPEEAGQFAALVETPPRLDSSRLIRESQVWRPIPEVGPNHPVYEAVIAKQLVPYFSNPREGLRAFGNYSVSQK